MSAARTVNPLLKLALEAGPLGVFFIGNAKLDIYRASLAFAIAVVVALAGSLVLERRLPVMPLVSAVFVTVFAGLTWWLHDDTFIKLKPTLVNSLFAAILFGGLLLGKSLLRPLFDQAFDLDDEGWRKLTFRWACYFVALAILNEIVWRSFDTAVWVNFKVFGIMPLTILFTLSQMPLINRHSVKKADD